MSSRRTMILIVAIALAVVASFALWSYIQGVEDDLAEDTVLVDVLIFTRAVEQGQTGETVTATALATEKIPANFLPGNAITNADQILGKVAISDFAARQILVPGMFVDSAVASVTFADYLAPNMVSYSMNIDQIAAAGGLLAPGDKINIMVRTSPQAEPEVTNADGSTEQTEFTTDSQGNEYGELVIDKPVRMLYQGAEILAINGRLTPQIGEAVANTAAPAGGGVFTFMVPADVAMLLASIPSETLIFSLIAQDYDLNAIDPLPEETWQRLPGEDPDLLTPCGPQGPQGCLPDDESAGDEATAGGLDIELPLGDASDAEATAPAGN